MTIKQILEMPIGAKFGGFDVVMKTAKKKWQAGDKWVQQVVISDETGDALADVNIKTYSPLQRGSSLHIIVGIVQAGVPEIGKDGYKKILIDQFSLPSDIGEPSIEYGQADKITRSKIKCWLVSAYIKAKMPIDKREINGHVDYIME